MTEYTRGECPCCHSLDLKYGERIVDADSIEQPFTCINCGATGSEYYDITYSHSEADKNRNLFTFEIGFTDSSGQDNKTQVQAKDIIGLALTIEYCLKDDLDIKEITYIKLAENTDTQGVEGDAQNKCSDKSVPPERVCIQKLPHACSPDDDSTDFNEAHYMEWMERHPYGYYNNEHDYGTGEENN